MSDKRTGELLAPVELALEYLRFVKGWSTHGPADISAEDLYDELASAIPEIRRRIEGYGERQIQCPDCNGEGEFFEADRFADEDGNRNVEHGKCERCHGDGWLIESKPKVSVEEKFVRHIESHLSGDQIPMCKICGKTILEINREDGVEVEP